MPILWCNMQLMIKLIVPPFSGVSFVTITLVSLDRLLALTIHMRYNSIVTNCGILTGLTFFWIGALIIASSNFWCVKIMNWSSVSIFALCLIICSVNNAIIFRILHRHRVDIQRQQQQLQVNHQNTDNINMAQRRKRSSTMLWVYLLFLLCYAPFLGARLLRNFKGKNTKALFVAFEFPYTLMYINSLLNPILYCVKLRAIRRAMFRQMTGYLRSIFSQHFPEDT